MTNVSTIIKIDLVDYNFFVYSLTEFVGNSQQTTNYLDPLDLAATLGLKESSMKKEGFSYQLQEIMGESFEEVNTTCLGDKVLWNINYVFMFLMYHALQCNAIALAILGAFAEYGFEAKIATTSPSHEIKHQDV